MCDTLDTTVQSNTTQFSGTTTSNLDHLCGLNPRAPAVAVRKTSIICTIGPSTNSKEKIRELIKNGMNIARVNLSHGTREEHIQMIADLREVSAEFPLEHVAIAVDTKGPEIRTGIMAGGVADEIELKDGGEIVVSSNPLHKETCTAQLIYIDLENLHKHLHIGSRIYIEDGMICLRMVEFLPNNDMRCVIENGGWLAGRQGVNLPGVSTGLPAVTEQDRDDLKFAIEQNVDIIFLSFIRDEISLKEIRIDMGGRGSHIRLIAKIENEEGVHNIDEIIKEADGVMVARGDLGIDIPTEKVFIAQKSIIAKCNIAGKPVICATQMLESMVRNPRATRAECSDIANAVLDGADCVMLSAETAKGAHPILALQCMHQVCTEAEAAFFTSKFLDGVLKKKPNRGKVETLALAATTAVLCSHASAIIVISITGMTAKMMAKFRPPVPIVTLCRDEQLARQMHLWRGILPLSTPIVEDNSPEGAERCIQFGIEEGRKRGFIKKGDTVLIVSPWPTAKDYSAAMRARFVD